MTHSENARDEVNVTATTCYCVCKIKREKPVLRYRTRGTVHCGFALRERAMLLRAIEEIRDLGLIANSRWGKLGYDLCCKVDYDNPRDRIRVYGNLKSWKARCRKRHQWIPSVKGEICVRWWW